MVVENDDGLPKLYLIEYHQNELRKANEVTRKTALCLCLAMLALLAAACDEGRPTQTPSSFLASTVTEEPTIALAPTVALELTVALPTMVVLEPAVTMEPTIESLPTAEMLPTVALEPTVAMETAGFDAPDPVEGLGDVQEALIGGQVFRLEVARTSQERAKGLMGREHLERDSAMLFVFAEEAQRSFWMKNTLIPLDILFLDSNGVVVDVQTMTPQPDAPDSELTVYPSAAPARYAIEMNAGLAKELGIEPGAQVLFR